MVGDKIIEVVENIRTVVKGDILTVKLALTALLARGHLLLEGPPGVGKTTLALAIARTLGCSFQRIQFTSDLLPADIIGLTIYDQKSGEFIFKPGPIFHHIVLADEINRATPRTQSALLESMGESQISVEGKTFKLPQPFMVLATQNPVDQFGTFHLPDSQLDRFLMKVPMSFPDREAEKDILKDGTLREKASLLNPILTPEEVEEMQDTVESIWVEQSILDYILNIADATRNGTRLMYGLSTRGSLYLLKATRAWAFIQGRDYIIPDDVKTIAPFVIAHRVRAEDTSIDIENIVRDLIEKVEVPL